MTLRFKDDGSWLPHRAGIYRICTGVATLVQSVSLLVSTQTGPMVSMITFVTPVFLMTTEINNIITGRLCVWWLQLRSEIRLPRLYDVAWDHVTSSTLSNLVKLCSMSGKWGKLVLILTSSYRGIDKVSVIIQCAWHIITTQLVLANMITGKDSISMFGHSSREQYTHYLLPWRLHSCMGHRGGKNKWSLPSLDLPVQLGPTRTSQKYFMQGTLSAPCFWLKTQCAC